MLAEPVRHEWDTAAVSKWLSASDRVRLVSQLVAEFENQFSPGQFEAVLMQFGIETNRAPENLFHSLMQDADDDAIAELGRHFTLDVPEKPAPEAVGHTPLDISDLDGYADLVSAETALREVIRLAVPKWIDDLTQEEVARLEEKRAEEDKRRDGITVSQDLLDYVEVYQLEKTIQKHWDPEVRAILDDKKRTDVYLGIIGDIRNTIGHSRPIYAAERLLLAGAARQIRNQLAVYRTRADGPQRHYPSIDSARDESGRKAYINGDGLWGLGDDPRDAPRLEVGDTVTFYLEATDPRGRELQWVGYSIPSDQSPSSVPYGGIPAFARASGNRVELTWTVGESDVGEKHAVQFTLSHSGRFHRHSSWDDGALFYFHVNPPRED